MKITFVCNEYPLRPHAGIGMAVQTVARGLSQIGHEITVVGLGDRFGEAKDGAIDVITLPMHKWPYLGNLVSRIKLRRWLTARAKGGDVDIIEVPDSQGLLPFGVKGCPVVVRLHLTFTAVKAVTGREGSAGISFYERRTLSQNSNWIAVSKYARDLTRTVFGLSAKRETIIYNAVGSIPSAIPRLPNLPDHYVLYAGNVCKRKGADLLAKALRDVMTERPCLHLVYVGGVVRENGQLFSQTISDILGPTLTSRTHFLGRLDREQVLSCMKHADVFAFPSHIEACPLVVLEAMACGVPVVFSKSPPGPELITDGATGMLADPSCPKEFGERIMRILDDRALANRLSQSAQEVIAIQFSIAKCTEATEKFYKDCVKDYKDSQRH
jgi:glycosyltransferase involved in cell wall biosynthesis